MVTTTIPSASIPSNRSLPYPPTQPLQQNYSHYIQSLPTPYPPTQPFQPINDYSYCPTPYPPTQPLQPINPYSQLSTPHPQPQLPTGKCHLIRQRPGALELPSALIDKASLVAVRWTSTASFKMRATWEAWSKTGTGILFWQSRNGEVHGNGPWKAAFTPNS